MKKYIRISFLCALVLCLALPAAAGPATGNLMERAKNLYDVQDYTHALALFNRVLELEADNGEAWDYAGWCQRYLSNWKKAEDAFRRALALLSGSDAKWVQVGLGETCLGAEAPLRATDAFQKAIDLAPDDDELVIRCLKGMALAWNAYGDPSQVASVMARLKEKDAAVALTVESDIASLNTRKSAADGKKKPTEPRETAASGDAAEVEPQSESPSSDGKFTDLDTRKQETVLQQTPPGTRETVALWEDFALGDTMPSVLAKLKEQGIGVRKIDEPTPEGTWLYTVELSGGSLLPELVSDDADAVICSLEEYDDRLLAVIASSSWKNLKSTVDLQKAFFDEMKERISVRYGECTALAESDTGMHSEARWIPDEKTLISLEATAGLDGTLVFSVSCCDLPGLNALWEKSESGDDEEQ